MLSLKFTLILLIFTYIYEQTDALNLPDKTSSEKDDQIEKIEILEENQTGKSILSSDTEQTRFYQNHLSDIQLLSSPCVDASPLRKLPYSKDKTKYIQCLDQFHYEIVSCPDKVEYNEETNTCNIIRPIINICEKEKPCLNDGHCIALSNETFKCACHSDWHGERCENPLNSCVKKPCGLNAQCRTLKVMDYEQDYVCVCNDSKSYGLNCQDVVPNPCLLKTGQFFAYAFSQRAYIQCEADRIHFQPCSPSLYWNQEETTCDHNRLKKVTSSTIRKKVISKLNNKNSRQNNVTTTTTTTTEPTKQNQQQQKEENIDNTSTFIPAILAKREHFLTDLEHDSSYLMKHTDEKDEHSSEQTTSALTSVESSQPNQNTNIELDQTEKNKTFLPDEQISEVTTKYDEHTGTQSNDNLIDSGIVQIQKLSSDEEQEIIPISFIESSDMHSENPTHPRETVMAKNLFHQKFPSSDHFHDENTLSQSTKDQSQQEVFIETSTTPQDTTQQHANHHIEEQEQSIENLEHNNLAEYTPTESTGFNSQTSEVSTTTEASLLQGSNQSSHTFGTQLWLDNLPEVTVQNHQTISTNSQQDQYSTADYKTDSLAELNPVPIPSKEVDVQQSVVSLEDQNKELSSVDPTLPMIYHVEDYTMLDESLNEQVPSWSNYQQSQALLQAPKPYDESELLPTYYYTHPDSSSQTEMWLQHDQPNVIADEHTTDNDEATNHGLSPEEQSMNNPIEQYPLPDSPYVQL